MIDTTIRAVAEDKAVEAGIGDVVTLRSGGPRMTVMYAGTVGFASGHWLICQWFDEHGELRQDMFAQDMVKLEPRSISVVSARLREKSLVSAGRG